MAKGGFTKFPNELMEWMGQGRLNGAQMAVLLWVARRSYGFHREEAEISVSVLADLTGMTDRYVAKTLAGLVSMGILKRYKGQKAYCYRFSSVLPDLSNVKPAPQPEEPVREAENEATVALPSKEQSNSCTIVTVPEPSPELPFRSWMEQMIAFGDERSIPSLYNVYVKKRFKDNYKEKLIRIW